MIVIVNSRATSTVLMMRRTMTHRLKDILNLIPNLWNILSRLNLGGCLMLSKEYQ